MSIVVNSPGLLSSIQDIGREGVGRYGIPRSGVMDQYSAKIANLRVGNTPKDAVMEITLTGPKLYFQESTMAAVSGLGAKIIRNKEDLPLNSLFTINKGDVLHIKQVTQGVRVYLAIKGGFRTDIVMGSRSFCENITSLKALQKESILPFQSFQNRDIATNAAIKFKKEYYQTNKIHVFRGPEWNRLSPTTKGKLLHATFTISKYNSRQAYQLQEKVENTIEPILTQPVLPGTVQLTPAGNVIILMRDAQTTGGYPRILQLTPESINRLSQKNTGEKVKLEEMK